MTRKPMQTCDFEQLVMRITQETDKSENKLQILYLCDGYLSGTQATKILYLFKIACHRLKAIEVMNKKLTKMTSNEARDMMQTFVIQEDKLTVLKLIKRFISDLDVADSKETLLSCFLCDHFKNEACAIIAVPRLTSKDLLPAGGHMQYSPLGSIFNQSVPLDPKLYQSEYQCEYPVKPQEMYRVPEIGVETSVKPPLYTDPRCNPLKPLPSSNKAFGCFERCPANKPTYAVYPSGAAPLGFHNPAERVGFEEDIPEWENKREYKKSCC